MKFLTNPKQRKKNTPPSKAKFRSVKPITLNRSRQMELIKYAPGYHSSRSKENVESM